jgi:hypothetical protein
MFTDRTLWTTTTDHFMSINILSLADNPKLECRLRTYGFLCALYMFVLGQAPLPCSPFLLLYSTGTHNLLFDLPLIQSLAPMVGGDLSAIPPYHSTPLDRTPHGPMDALVSTHFGYQVCFI